ncbi:hemolysin family protein [Rhodopirellula sp.]|jgi:CBS domain containing-hemolysin-like protein|nr:hemolysin family protein [Rhodopirellula sp.]
MSTMMFLVGAVVLIILNGFFVAAEFALVKVRVARIDQMVKERRPFAPTARWLADRLDESLSACQLGITMASLGLGWVGEPAFAALLERPLEWMGVTDPQIVHVIGFAAAFSVITGLHLVVGEQFPKIFAIRRPETMLLWCAAPLKFSYIILYPFLAVLNESTSFLLKRVGIHGTAEHDGPVSEDEIRVILRDAHVRGNLSRNEHSLINNVFEFDDLIVRRVMVPRNEVAFFDVDQPLAEILDQVRLSKHTRYPVCDGSLDEVLGVVHIKDLLGIPIDSERFNLRDLMRPPKKVPETMPISRVLRHFQATHQLLAMVIDEYGVATGVVTLENVLEEIVGPVEDEFDTEQPDFVPIGSDEFLVNGSVRLDEARKELSIPLEESDEADTISGLLMDVHQKILAQGDVIQLQGGTAEVVEVKNDCATKVKFKISTQ